MSEKLISEEQLKKMLKQGNDGKLDVSAWNNKNIDKMMSLQRKAKDKHKKTGKKTFTKGAWQLLKVFINLRP